MGMGRCIIGLLVVLSAAPSACSSPDGAGPGASPSPGNPGVPSGQGGASAGGAGPAAGAGTLPGGGNANSAGSAPVGEGILGCVTLAPPTRSQPPAALSAAFGNTCGACHGATGIGTPLYPAIPGMLSLEEFRSIVRGGREAMPAFPADYYPDAQLEADFAALRQGAGQATPSADPIASLSQQELEQRYATGLALWRKADAKGAACASCHTPDAIDLAVIGYGDDAILRRALLHLSVEDSLGVVELVHVQRARFGISAPCDPAQFRPFQPGGAPLPGETVDDQELSFAEHLRSLNLLIMTGRVDSLAQAIVARDQLLGIDLRKLRIGIPLARWTEDGFNGPEHNTINDWIPELPRIANSGQEATLRQLEDAYISEPTTANLLALMDQLEELTHDGGFAASFNDQYGYGDNWLTGAMLTKKLNALLGQHFMRMAVLKQPGWLELGPVPFPERGDHFNPFFGLAQSSLGAPCANDPVCGEKYITQFPPEILEEAPPIPENRPDQYSSLFISQVTHPWFTLGQLFDQGLVLSGGAGHNTTEAVYWNALHFPHDRIHKLFFNAHRALMQTQYKSELGNVGLATMIRYGGELAAAPPLLTGDWLKVNGVGLPGDDSPLLSHAAPMHLNTVRMFLYLMQDLLSQGQNVSYREELLRQLEDWQGFVSELREKVGDSQWAAKTGLDAAFVEDSAQLLTSVVTAVQSAADVPTEGAGTPAY